MLVLIALLAIFVESSNALIACGSRDFVKPDVIGVVEECLEQNNCKSPRNYPERLVQNIRKHYQITSIEVNQVFDCAGESITSLPTELQTMVNSTGFFSDPYSKQCSSLDEICKKNFELVFPVICFLETACGKREAQIAYALYYALEMVSAETNKPLNCSGTSRYDVNLDGTFQDFCQQSNFTLPSTRRPY